MNVSFVIRRVGMLAAVVAGLLVIQGCPGKDRPSSLPIQGNEPGEPEPGHPLIHQDEAGKEGCEQRHRGVEDGGGTAVDVDLAPGYEKEGDKGGQHSQAGYLRQQARRHPA